MKRILQKRVAAERRAHRTRSRIRGTAARPRLTVFRSKGHMYAQVIDDGAGKTLASASDLSLKISGKTSIEVATEVGSAVAKAATKAGVTMVVFDRGQYLYHGRVKALAEAARAAGLQF